MTCITSLDMINCMAKLKYYNYIIILTVNMTYAGLRVSNNVRRIWITLTIADSFFSLSKIFDSSCSTVSCLRKKKQSQRWREGRLKVSFTRQIFQVSSFYFYYFSVACFRRFCSNIHNFHNSIKYFWIMRKLQTQRPLQEKEHHS